MNIRWLGHSCFLFTNQEGLRVLTDPFDEKVGYPVPRIETDIVTVSHHHHDHDSVQVLPGKPQIVDGEGSYSFSGLSIKGTATFHDTQQGAKRGKNTLFSFTMDGVHIVHLGDLGHLLTPEQLADVGQVDIACIPVGGFYTIDAEQAYQVVQQLNPKIVLPMHYKPDETSSLPIEGNAGFLAYFAHVKMAKALDISPSSLPRTQEAIVLELYEAE
ncbi:Zn-dependent hydrolase of the beta-lactamase fold [Candidatus Desulfosporosinus infrequens]|uniref:Zn-dependent hydrolase of the beta-lactamase fold n=1 Tax=Candidatus Desulfosporosinus infrequens TaxID=2043169 RepID=A0A2U3L1G8_9FIRM|nr:Zn-dependent hydrolase of the beta-lactamase fold [Candidatus Desulfosporosinus infrequens]